jgi:hypothetical protein
MGSFIPVDDYWTDQEFIARLLIPPKDHERDVFFLWHQSRERYGRGHKELGLTLNEPGQRDYVHTRACFFSPHIILTVALTPSEQTDLGRHIGEVADSRTEGQVRHDIANLQAWYYGSEKTLMLWEVDMFGPYSEGDDPTKDFLLSSLWQCFETRLLKRFPECERILTPHSEPRYENELFRAFLRDRGYQAGPEMSGVFEKAARLIGREREIGLR